VVTLAEVCSDLADEHGALDGHVATLAADEWDLPTPAAGWTVRDQISHLTYFDGTAALALVDPDGFAQHLAEDGDALAGATPPDVALGRSLAPSELLERWRAARRRVLDALAGADPAARVPWYGPAMSPTSFGTARLMETWAHGVDVTDTAGRPPASSARLRHVIHIGVRARPYAFLVNGLADPPTPVTVVADAPDGSAWTWGDPGGPEALRGPALDLALVFTQRRHPADTAVVASGAVAQQWLAIAQAFAGPAGPGRARAGGG
jgi:uncharacterized protein (TIGR03084 family)